jgi:hypothetical protein
MQTTSPMEPEIDLNQLYDAAIRTTGSPLEFRIFDVQLCGALDKAWLLSTADGDTLTPADVEHMLDQQLLKQWTNVAGEQGFILYTTEQAKTLKQLLASQRYSLEELRHIMKDWDDYLETIIMVEPPYDDRAIPDYEHFQRRVQENITHFLQEQACYKERPTPELDEDRRTGIEKRLAGWQRVHQNLLGKTEETLSPKLRDAINKELFHLRWLDEWIRLSMVEQHCAAIVQGYSPEVTFRSWSSHQGVITDLRIDWSMTLDRLRNARREGTAFPLRTPAFNLSERGIELLEHLSPAAYERLHAEYALDELFGLLDRFGTGLWAVPSLPTGSPACPECGTLFERTSTARVYCTDRCRKKAKSRRWRERDPERARLAQARYWQHYTETP